MKKLTHKSIMFQSGLAHFTNNLEHADTTIETKATKNVRLKLEY